METGITCYTRVAVVEAFARDAATAPTPMPRRCPLAGCRGRHESWNALRAAIQANLDTLGRAARVGGWVTSDVDLRKRGLWCGWDQNSLRVGPLIRHSMQQRIHRRKYNRSWLVHTRASGHSSNALDIFNQAPGEHRPNRDLSTAESLLLRAIKVWNYKEATETDNRRRKVNELRFFGPSTGAINTLCRPCYPRWTTGSRGNRASS